MKGACLKFYVHEHRRRHGILLYEWLLERAGSAPQSPAASRA